MRWRRLAHRRLSLRLRLGLGLLRLVDPTRGAKLRVRVRCRRRIVVFLFVFLNRRYNQVKLLVWTRGGYTIVHKRLERGKFLFTKRVKADAQSVEIDVHELSMLLEGIDVTRARTSTRWEPPKHTRVA